MAHARRYFYKALESDQARMGPALLLIAQLYKVEERAQAFSAARVFASIPIMPWTRRFGWPYQTLFPTGP